MKSDAETLVDAFYAAWRARDIETSMYYFADDVHIVFHFGNSVIFSGESRGKAAAREKLEKSGDGWQFVELKQTYNHVEPNLVRCRCPFVIRHVRSGATLEGTLRHIFSLRDGQIAKFEAFIDVAMLKTFMRLIGLRRAA
ncbi:MAG: nuclear transport factor 2 family protein [Hyphomicrobiaceae bacterium]|nr:nuclear transport factor 2 family protein [Hyphomicrobiaceae bacterium]